MKNRFFTLVTAMTLACIILAGCLNVNQSAASNNKLLYNQVGYLTSGPKLLLLADDVDLVVIRNAAGAEVFRGVPESSLYWELSGDAVRKLDFSALTEPGEYTVVLPGEAVETKIRISERPFKALSRAALRAFYYNRASMAIEPSLGGLWTRPEGHPDTIVYVHSSAASDKRPEGYIISSPLGWYDAGDYNKYIVNSGITTYTMFRALQDFTAYYAAFEVDIPETGSGVPDVLSETMYNYLWMLSMQDPDDGGVYHKLTNKDFDGIVMPHEAVEPRYVVKKSTSAALNFAAVAAMASRVLRDFSSHYPGLAEKSLQQARMAWQWAVDKPGVLYRQPADIQTGAYGDGRLDDEFFWAACELFLASGEQSFLDVILEKYTQPQVPTWNHVYALGFMSLLDHYESLPAELRNKGLRADFFGLVDGLVDVANTSPYGVSIQHFVWGSNSSVANEGMLKLVAYKHTADQKYLRAAMADLDYILGRNATGYCFVTGFGHTRVMHIHHRPSEADGVEEPVPGFLAGGPNLATFADCPPEMERSRFPAKSYVDHWCSYSTNEIAINWNAPLVYLTGAIDAITAGKD